ncbi:protein of unknown function DUF1127 [Methylobacterium sp. 4-46]|nr:protein of unknown function DUF1127 [Methylobacterium sp. 4-46]
MAWPRPHGCLFCAQRRGLTISYSAHSEGACLTYGPATPQAGPLPHMVRCNRIRRRCRHGRQELPTKGSTTMFVSVILSKIRAYLRYRETVVELSRLTDRELDDLGISRSDIVGIARTHAA